MGDLRAEIWARPGASTFERIYADALTERLSGTVRANGIGDGQFEFPDFDGADTLADLLLRVDDASLAAAKRALIRVYGTGQQSGVDPPLHEWLVDAVVPPGTDNNPRWQVSGNDGLEWLNHASVFPWDWDGTTAFVSAFPDHIWGGRNVLGELRCSHQPEVVTFTVNDNVDGGTFTIGVSNAAGSDTTAAIDYDATALAVYNALLATTVIDALEVDGEAGGPWTVTVLEPDLPIAMSTNNGNLVGTWALELGGATGGTFTLTFNGETTGSIAWDATAATIETAVEGLASVTDATVTGSAGSFTIAFNTPDTRTTGSITDSTTGGSGATLTENEAAVVAAVQTQGTVLPVGWVSSEFSPTDMEHGTLQSLRCWRNDGFDPALPTGADTAGVFNGREPYFPGVEKPVRVQPGGIYQASVWVYARDDDTDIRLVLRDVADNQASAPGDTNYFVEQTVTADTWTQLTITDFRPADDVEEIKFRIGHVGADGVDPPIIYWALPQLLEGQAPTSIGGVWLSLFADAHTDHVADGRIVWEDEANPGNPYLTCDFTAAVDSAGVAWDTSDVEITVKRGWSYGRALKETFNLDYEARVVPDPVTDGAWLFQLFNPGGMDDDYSGDSFVGVRTGVDVIRRQTKRFRPGGTAQTVEGANRRFAFAVNTTAETALGRMEQYLPDRDLNGATEIATAASTLLAEGLKRAISKTLTVQPGPDDPAPLVNYVPGDTIPVVDPPDTDTDLRVAAINYVVAPDVGTRYEVSMASERAVGSAAIRAGVIQYLREQKEIREEPPNDSGTPYLLRSVAALGSASQTGDTVTTRSSVRNEHNTGTEMQLNIPPETSIGDLLVFAATLRRNAGDPGVNPPAGWTERVDGGGTGSVWVSVFTRVADGSETDTTFTTTSSLDAQGMAGITVAYAPPEGFTDWTHTIDVSALSENASATTTPVFPPVTLTGGDQPNKIVGALFTIDELGGFDVTDYTGMSLIDKWEGGSGNPLTYMADETVTTSDPTYTPSDWTADQLSTSPFYTLTIAIHGGGSGVVTDESAIHDNVAGEIAAITEKTTPVSADLLVIEDSADSNNKKRLQIGNLPGGASDHGTLTGLTDDDHTQYLLAAGTRAATYLEVSGLTGATGSTPRFVGGTTTGAPVSGTFALGDYIVTEDGNIYVCTTAGTPGTWTAVGAGSSTDPDAIHDNVAGEISAITAKATPTTSDFLMIEDAADSNAKKRITIGDLPSGGGSSSPVSVQEAVDATPGSPDAMDDEFDDGSLDVKWSTLNLGTATTAESQNSFRLESLPSADQWRGIYQSAPSGDWKIRAKVWQPHDLVSNMYNGIFAAQSTTGSVRWVGWFGGGIRALFHNTPTSSAGSWAGGQTTYANFAYVELEWDDTAGVLYGRLSFTGIDSDFRDYVSVTTGYTPAIVGVGGASRGTAGKVIVVDWFRRIA